MCGRYGRVGGKQKIADAFKVKAELDEVDFEDDLDARPGSIQPVITQNEAGELVFRMMRWGFKTSKALLFNTRAATAGTNSFWKKKFEEGRVIVPATSFYEWQGEKAHKTKFEITVPHHHFIGLAGVSGLWKNERTGEWEWTFSVLTSDSNSVMVEVHDRQPIIIEPKEQTEWFEQTERPPEHLLRVWPDTAMKMTRVEGEAKPAQKGLFG